MSIKITGSSGAKSASGPKRTKGVGAAGGSSFADQLKAASGASNVDGAQGAGALESSAVDGVEGVDAILAMQEAGDGGQERARKQAKAYGDELLDRLAELQNGLLIGAIPKEQLVEIAHKIRSERKRVDDKRLNDILDEIELRAEVEIAKYTR